MLSEKSYSASFSPAHSTLPSFITVSFSLIILLFFVDYVARSNDLRFDRSRVSAEVLLAYLMALSLVSHD